MAVEQQSATPFARDYKGILRFPKNSKLSCFSYFKKMMSCVLKMSDVARTVASLEGKNDKKGK